MENWRKKDIWTRGGKDFLIEISQHRTGAIDDDRTENKWCIYAYIYPKHPQFGKFEGDRIWQDATELGMHGGCSYLRYHFDATAGVTSVQVGCDYNHLGDDRYLEMGTEDDARAVFNDADSLFDRLTSIANLIETEEKS